MIHDDPVAKRVAIHSYRASIQYFGANDSTTRDLVQRILAVQEQHADALASLPTGMPHA